MHRRHAGVISSDYWDYQPEQRVMTIDGLPGVVVEVQDGPVAGNENYVVQLDHGMGGGNYTSGMLAPLRQSTAAEVTATGIHLAAEDYPELGTIVEDRPDPGKLTFAAAKVVPNAERAAADAEDHDEEDPVAIDPSPGSGASGPATGEVQDNPQPSSCSYCGGTDFEDLRDNGRVRQATCSTCKGTMSAHPGLQWSPELIGDPSNHPQMTVDPHSGASPAAGASGGVSGINDSAYSDATRLGKLAAAEDDETKTVPTKRVGFAGYVEAEKTNFPDHGDNPDWADEQAVGSHAGVHEFRGYSGRENDFAHWHEKGEITHVPLHGSTVYATQPRVTQHGLDTYLGDPGHKSGSGRPHYPANDRPIFVKHQGDYFTLDGHHRTAAAMLRGDEHIEGHVYDADQHGFPKPEWAPSQFKRLPKTLEKYSALAGAYLGCGFDTDDEADAFQHELDHHDDGFCSAPASQRKTAAVDGADWCTWRRTARCTYPGDITADGHVLGIPQDRGPCPWETRWQQQVCPISEPGPGAAMERKGSVNRTLLHIAGIPSLPDRVASSETTALEARMASDFNPHEIQRALDKATDEEYDRHQDDGKYAENNNPLHLSDLHPDRAAQFAFHHNTPEAHNPFKDLLPDHKDLGVGQHEAPVNLTHYKSPMAMEPLHLDEHGNSWRRHYKWSHPDARVPDFRGWSGPHSATETLNQHPTWSQSFDADGKRHHHMRTHLEREQKAGVLPGETHGELVQRRNKALSQGGWSVLSAAGRIAEQMREKLGPGSANSVPVQKVATEEGWVGHRPPGPNGTGAPLHDLNDVHGQHGGSPFGTNSDVYSHPQHWTGFHDHELDRTIKSAEGKPDAPITIYRAQPAEHHGIRSGDWVTTSANYAHIHGADGFDGPVHVVKAVVPAHHVWTNADDIAEAGYHGPHIEHALHHADVED